MIKRTMHCDSFRVEENRYYPLFKVNQFYAEYKTEDECLDTYDRFFRSSSVVPITLNFVNVPARTVLCNHIQPFDLALM